MSSALRRRNAMVAGTLTDTGPLIALLNRRDPDHERCVAALEQLEAPMLTVLAAFAEAMYLLGHRAGWAGQQALWSWVADGVLRIAEYHPGPGLKCDEHVLTRSQALIAEYRDLPMDLADAMLVAWAERNGLQRVFSLDKHFHAYRLHGRTAFEVIPG